MAAASCSAAWRSSEGTCCRTTTMPKPAGPAGRRKAAAEGNRDAPHKRPDAPSAQAAQLSHAFACLHQNLPSLGRWNAGKASRMAVCSAWSTSCRPLAALLPPCRSSSLPCCRQSMAAGRQPAERKWRMREPPGMRLLAPAAVACRAAARAAGRSHAGSRGRETAACTAAEMAASAGSRPSCGERTDGVGWACCKPVGWAVW